MNYSFNLLEEDWIHCRMNDGERREMNLVDALCESHKVCEIQHYSPLVTVALHRLLLAVLHRVFGPSDWRAWRDIREGSCFDEIKLQNYLEHWKERFDLFHKKYPFYQTSSLSLEYATSAAKLFHELASGNNKTLFDHTLMVMPPILTPAEAARLTVTLQAYALGGLVSSEKGRKKNDGSADSAFIVKGASFLATGRNLFETLMLNLVQYNAQDEEPFPFNADKDKPAWECDYVVKPIDRLPYGYLDWLTWQSRRIRLKPETDDSGKFIIREVVIMKGFQLPDNQWRHARETMIAFIKNEKPTKQNPEPWNAISFTEEKALWRNILAFLQSLSNKRSQPKVMEWLADLKANGALLENQRLPISTYGMCSNRANVSFWRHERLPLSGTYLNNIEIINALKNVLELSEEAGIVLRDANWILARLALFPDEGKDLGKEAKKDINHMCEELSPGRMYWPRLETPFKQLLEDLPEDKSTDQYGSTVYGEKVIPKWAETIRHTAQEAFDIACSAVGESARAFKARAKAESVFRKRLNSLLKPYTENVEEGGDEA